MDALVKTYERVLVLNLLNVDHPIENSDVEILESIIQQNPLKTVKYKYKNLTNGRQSIVDTCIELITELSPIYKAFQYFQSDAVTENVLKFQEGCIRVNCSDVGDTSDLFTIFHFLAVFKSLFYAESTAEFSSFAKGFVIASTMNVMGIRNMLMNTFRRLNPLLNSKDSGIASCLSTEIPLEFEPIRQNANKIQSS